MNKNHTKPKPIKNGFSNDWEKDKGALSHRFIRIIGVLRALATVLLLALPALRASADETITYTYDTAGRLTNAAYDNANNIAYAYDANGNLLLRTTTGEGPTYTLIYRAGTGGQILGLATQRVVAGQNASAVTAGVQHAGAVFHSWNDGTTHNPRTDINVHDNQTLLAAFASTGGASLDWYTARGITPETGENWTDVDARTIPAKGTTLLIENIADTNPDHTNDLFRTLAIQVGPPVTVQFQPGSTGRVYSLQFTDDLTGIAWSNLPGIPPRLGDGGVDTLTDTNNDPSRLYRVWVELP